MHFCRFIGLWIRVPWCSSCPCAARLGWSSRHNRWLTASARRTPAPIQRNCLIVMLKNELFKNNWFNFRFVQLCLFNFSLVWVLEYEPDSQQNIWRKTLPTEVMAWSQTISYSVYQPCWPPSFTSPSPCDLLCRSTILLRSSINFVMLRCWQGIQRLDQTKVKLVRTLILTVTEVNGYRLS